MGKMKDLAIQIDENDCEDFMAFNLGITMEELKLLSFSEALLRKYSLQLNSMDSRFSVSVVFCFLAILNSKF